MRRWSRRCEALADESIYDEPGRLAQPDEVWNYGRGDGPEKALLLANVLRARYPGARLTITLTPEKTTLDLSGGGSPKDSSFSFKGRQGLRPQTWDCGA